VIAVINLRTTYILGIYRVAAQLVASRVAPSSIERDREPEVLIIVSLPSFVIL
jgi:hypothetical protein